MCSKGGPDMVATNSPGGPHVLPDTMHYLRMDATTQKFCGTSPLTVWSGIVAILTVGFIIYDSVIALIY